MVGQVEGHVEPSQVALLQVKHRLDLMFGEHHAADRVLDVRQWAEAHREEILGLDLLGSHFRQLLPGHALGELDAHALLQGLATAGRLGLGGAVAEIVTLFQELSAAA